jgi:choline kinase
VCNERYRETSGLYSLWLASDQLSGGAFVLEADVLFTPLLLERLRWHPAPDALLYDSSRSLGPEGMKVRVAGSYVVDLNTHMRPGVAGGEHVGILKFGGEGSARLARILSQLVTAGEKQAEVPRAVAELAHRWPIVAIDTDGLPWTVVDYPEDLVHAQQVVDPEIAASLTPPARFEEPQLMHAAGAR